jgi:ribosomal protein S18 acetylase RimI-like enzyme
LFRRLGCAVTELFCEVDGQFPNHHPDPSQPKNLRDLIRCLATSDIELGLAFDGDGDRLGIVTRDGTIIYPDRQLMLFAADVLARNPGAIVIYDVKSTRNLQPWIRRHGGTPLMWKTGHSLIKSKMKETGALLAGEMSGHTFFKERWYGFDDGMYAGARLLEILSRYADASAVLTALPDSISTPELNVPCTDTSAHQLIAAMGETAEFPGAAEVIRIERSARRVRRWLRPGASFEYHAGDRAALRSRQRGCAETDPRRIPPCTARIVARPRTAILMTIEYSTSVAGVDWAELKADLAADFFDNGRTPEQMARSFSASYRCVVGRHGQRIVGTGRVLSDGVCNAYLVDMWTHSAYRRQGIGRRMLEVLCEGLAGQHLYLFTDDADPSTPRAVSHPVAPAWKGSSAPGCRTRLASDIPHPAAHARRHRGGALADCGWHLRVAVRRVHPAVATDGRAHLLQAGLSPAHR